MHKYAVIRTGGKQYRVSQGEKIKVEKLDLAVGSNLNLTDVLLVANGEQVTFGAPIVTDAKVVAEILEHGKNKKVNTIKFKRRKHHLKRQGHRQQYTKLQILEIE